MKEKNIITNNNKIALGKYVLVDFNTGDTRLKFLRYINRESDRYFYSDTQRHCIDYDKPCKYVFEKNWATKFYKDKNNSLGFKTHTDRTYKIYDKPSEVFCEFDFEEVFNNDLRMIQTEKDSPLQTLITIENMEKKTNPDYTSDYKVKLFKESNNQWDSKILDKLKKLFNVSEIYSTSYLKIYENNKQSILMRSATYFHLNQFNLNKDVITRDENYYNRTIAFWLFKDKLVYQYEDGIKSW